jgi:hypothetical protein
MPRARQADRRTSVQLRARRGFDATRHRIEATFELHWLGLSVYRCHHLAIERWRGN